MIENSLWTERFRPQTLDDYVGNEHLKEKIQSYIDNNDVSHLLLYGVQGTGKTTLAKILTKSIECDELYINASDENNVDTVRDKIKGFASTMGFKRWKVVILDECLEKGTLVSVLKNGMSVQLPIDKLDPVNDLIKSYNLTTNEIEWMPFELWDIGKREIWELELENGMIIRCTENHKWFVRDVHNDTIVVTTKELYKYEYILSPI